MTASEFVWCASFSLSLGCRHTIKCLNRVNQYECAKIVFHSWYGELNIPIVLCIPRHPTLRGSSILNDRWDTIRYVRYTIRYDTTRRDARFYSSSLQRAVRRLYELFRRFSVTYLARGKWTETVVMHKIVFIINAHWSTHHFITSPPRSQQTDNATEQIFNSFSQNKNPVYGVQKPHNVRI